MQTSRMVTLLAVLPLLLGAGACTGATPEPDGANSLAITATDYAFDAPSSMEGGLVEVAFSNAGEEPHFVGFAKAVPGKSFADVRATLAGPPPGSAPPAGPPPFEPFGGVPAADPGVTGNLVLNLSPGTYALFCSIPSPDGTPHVAKGMIRELVVSEGRTGELPASNQTVTATDFALASTGELVPGAQIVKLRNDGRQLHEINLIELPTGRDVGDVLTWLAKPAGPPPHRSRAGVAVKPGEEATTELDLEPGRTYALVCVIPDVLGDRAPHATKGMFTPSFRA